MIRPVGDSIYLRLIDGYNNKGNVILPSQVHQPVKAAVVVALGDGVASTDLAAALTTPLHVCKVDDVILYPTGSAGFEDTLDSVTYRLMSEHDILAVVEPDPPAKHRASTRKLMGE